MSTSGQNSQQKTNKGRRRVNIARIENESNLQVTFSKRRAGVFKKTSEICTLTGAEGAVVVFSPSDKVYSFGSPDVYTIANRFDSQNPPPFHYDPNNPLLGQVDENGSNMELAQIEGLLAIDKKRAREIKEGLRALEMPKVGELDYQQLDQMKGFVESFGNNISSYVQNCTSQSDVYDPMQCPYAGLSTGTEPNLGFPSATLGFPSGHESNFGFPSEISGFPARIDPNPSFPYGMPPPMSHAPSLNGNVPFGWGLNGGEGKPNTFNGINDGFGSFDGDFCG